MTRDAVLKILKDYYDANRERYGIVRLGVFGSVARDEATDDSDVDVVVELEQPKAFSLVHIREGIEALCGVHVDIIQMRRRMNERLKRRVIEDAAYV